MDEIQITAYIDAAIAGNKDALECVLLEVKDMVYNLSLRMLGMCSDAEDATSDILIKVMTHLHAFRKEAKFSTWVYAIATNYLIDYKKGMFAQRPLDFEIYANDIRAGYTSTKDELMLGVSKAELSEELKLSCTNVMLQCLQPQDRCIFILGTMFHVDSKVAGEILGMTPENYRKKLSRARKQMGEFLKVNCGLSGCGACDCEKRIGHAILQHRLDPQNLEYTRLPRLQAGLLHQVKEAMDDFDDQMAVFAQLPKYQYPNEIKSFIEELVSSGSMKEIKHYKGEKTYG